MTIEDLKKLRRQLDAYSQLVGEFTFVKNIGVSVDVKDFNSSKNTYELVGFPDYVMSEASKRCENSLLLAKAWTGKMLEHIGDPSPYKNEGKNVEAKTVDPTNAKVDITPWKEKNKWEANNPIQKVEQLRVMVQLALNDIQGFFPDAELMKSLSNGRSFSIARTEVEVNLIEARFQLGFELGRMRDEALQPALDYNTPLYGAVKQK